MSSTHNPETLPNTAGKDSLKELNESIQNSVAELEAKPDILGKLLQEVQPIDFSIKAFPNSVKNKKEADRLEGIIFDADGGIIEGMQDQHELYNRLKKELSRSKLTKNHYLIICIEELLKIAEANKWGLCKKNNSIYLCNGCYWEEIEKERFQFFLGNVALKMGVEKFKGKIHTFREELFKQFLSDAYLPEPENKNNNILINLKNGTFEISATSRKLRGFDAKDFLTYQLPFDYDPKATVPMFQKYLDEVLPNKEKQAVLSEFCGYVFVSPRVLKLEKMLVLFGTGANGKSVFFEIIQKLFGEENTSNYTLESLTDVSGYCRAKIGNKLVNYASEISDKLDAGFFKQIASGEPIQARLPYGNPFTLNTYAKMIFNCNKLPTDVEHTDGFFRRFMIIHFDVTIPEADQDKELHTKIINSELAGVFNWVLAGLDRVLALRNFSKCEAVENAGKTYQNESDSVKLFIDEKGYKISTIEKILISDLYPLYKLFCADDGYKATGKKGFIARLNHHKIFVTREKTGNLVYLTKPNQDIF